ncbi:unnamed protein product [Gongylonema pulchrum]|uniref:Head decoration protein n=1 Tax=Gongylonema pulchrum TaxID=637853 RepID=A0A183DC55_9BILA|nr:unnamed protein product [Gongylonema pulchrum]
MSAQLKLVIRRAASNAGDAVTAASAAATGAQGFGFPTE